MMHHFKKAIFILLLIIPLEIQAQSLSMDSCKYFAELVNKERAKRFRRRLEYKEDRQLILDKYASTLVKQYNHHVNERRVWEMICHDNSLKGNLKMLMMSKKHRKGLMSKGKTCVGIFKKDEEYYVCVRVYY